MRNYIINRDTILFIFLQGECALVEGILVKLLISFINL